VQRAGGNLSEAARLLGLSRPQLAYRQKIKQASPRTSAPLDPNPSEAR
jgi:DNA-binding protein Fis